MLCTVHVWWINQSWQHIVQFTDIANTKIITKYSTFNNRYKKVHFSFSLQRTNTSALREEMLGETIISCKCSRHRIPQVTDVELDKFLREIPRNQLVVLCVVSSLFRNAMPCTDMLLRLYERQNRNRTRLCYQVRTEWIPCIDICLSSSIFIKENLKRVCSLVN